MFARRVLFLSGILALSLMLLGAQPMRPMPGEALPYGVSGVTGVRNDARLQQISTLAARISVSHDKWASIASRLETAATEELGPLNAMDRYWLGSAWWAIHQPSQHLTRPAWAPKVSIDPNLALAHPEGGNCESSANGHAALLNALGVPTVPVYGYHLGAKESHVWTMSDVDGRPMMADVHLARDPDGIWTPRAQDVMSEPSREAALAFLRVRVPDNSGQFGVVR